MNGIIYVDEFQGRRQGGGWGVEAHPDYKVMYYVYKQLPQQDVQRKTAFRL